MKLSITTLVLASTLGLLGVEAHPSPASPIAPAPLFTRELQERALVARERALLRPAWRPATPVIAVAPGANAPLRRSRGRAVDGKNAFRHRAGQRALHPHGDGPAQAEDSLITAAPVHISYNADLAMPFPLARHLSSRNGHVKRDAAAAETDADEEDDWDCEEEEQAEDESSSAVEPSFTPSEASSAWSEPSSSAWSETTPASETGSQEQQHAESTTTQEAQPTSTPAATESDARSNPKIAAEQSSKAQASSDSSASDTAPAPSSSGTSPIRNATGELPAGAAPVSEEPVNLIPGSLTADQGCTRFHTVMKGEICLGLLDWSKDIGLTLEQLYSYNPTINSECSNLAVGSVVCLGKA